MLAVRLLMSFLAIPLPPAVPFAATITAFCVMLLSVSRSANTCTAPVDWTQKFVVYGIGALFLLLWLSIEPSSTITPSGSAGISVTLTLSKYQPEVASAGALFSLL